MTVRVGMPSRRTAVRPRLVGDGPGSAEGLTATVEEFNHDAAAGRDSQYQRGETAYERALGDPDADHPNLGTTSKAPFFALPLTGGVESPIVV